MFVRQIIQEHPHHFAGLSGKSNLGKHNAPHFIIGQQDIHHIPHCKSLVRIPHHYRPVIDRVADMKPGGRQLNQFSGFIREKFAYLQSVSRMASIASIPAAPLNVATAILLFFIRGAMLNSLTVS